MSDALTAIAAAIGGAILAIGTGILLEYFTSERDRFWALCEAFCKLIADAADAGSDFWLADPKMVQTVALAARLGGFQNRISGYNVLLTSRISDEHQDEIDSSLAELFNCLTGGEADNPARQPSPDAAAAVHDAASAAILAIRRAAFDRLGLLAHVDAFIRWRQRKLVSSPPQHPFRGR